MKKFLVMAMIALFSVSGIYAQSVKTTTKADNKAKVEVKKDNVQVKTEAPKADNGTKLKKDGTPDKRYKENKHLKKDGTPDKRYKENQK